MLNEIVYFYKVARPMHFDTGYMESKAAFLPKTKGPKLRPKLDIVLTFKIMRCAKLYVAIKTK